jgi:hypothetical protein
VRARLDHLRERGRFLGIDRGLEDAGRGRYEAALRRQDGRVRYWFDAAWHYSVSRKEFAAKHGVE